MTKLQKKIIRYSLYALSIICLMLIIIITPIYTEVIIHTKIFNEYENACIALMVLIPFLVSLLSFFISEKFKTWSVEEAKQKLESIYQMGYIEIDKYIDMLQYLDNLEEKRINAKIQIATKKEIAKIKSQNQMEELITKAKQGIYEEPIIREKEEEEKTPIVEIVKKEEKKSIKYY